MKNKFWNRFLTWNPHNSDGFTLVELIVVIAILAILAAVAVPAYNGYIEKARKAADEQLLAAVNTAFAAACAENGEDMIKRTSADTFIMLNANRVNSVSPYNDTFFKYFAGNEDTPFATIKGLKFDDDLKVFVPNENMVVVAYGNGTIYIAPEDAERFGISNFNNKIGTEKLLGMVNDVTNLAAWLCENDDGRKGLFFDNLWKSPEFLMSAANAMGVSTEGLTYEEIYAKMGQEAEKLAASTEGSKTVEEILANATVLYAAQNSTKMDRESINALLMDPSIKSTIINGMDASDGKSQAEALSQASLAYGMYTSYIYSQKTAWTEDQKKDATASPINALNDMSNMSDEEREAFNIYIASDDGKKDLDAYMAAMNMINSSSGDPDAVKQLMTQGFGDSALVEIIDSIVNPGQSGSESGN